METTADAIVVNGLSFYYDKTKILNNINLKIPKGQITSLIGPSGCGKTTLLRCLNRVHDFYQGNSYTGDIYFDGINIMSDKVDMNLLRSRLCMVFQNPTPFPMSIFDNVVYGLKLKGVKNKNILEERVESTLKQTGLWEEVSGRLRERADKLSAGQQQRMVIARALAVEPDVILFDEPTVSLDAVSANKIEDLIVALKGTVTMIVVTHNMQQAARISDYTAFMNKGEIIEFGKTDNIFARPENKLTEDYITGRFI